MASARLSLYSIAYTSGCSSLETSAYTLSFTACRASVTGSGQASLTRRCYMKSSTSTTSTIRYRSWPRSQRDIITLAGRSTSVNRNSGMGVWVRTTHPISASLERSRTCPLATRWITLVPMMASSSLAMACQSDDNFYQGSCMYRTSRDKVKWSLLKLKYDCIVQLCTKEKVQFGNFGTRTNSSTTNRLILWYHMISSSHFRQFLEFTRWYARWSGEYHSRTPQGCKFRLSIRSHSCTYCNAKRR